MGFNEQFAVKHIHPFDMYALLKEGKESHPTGEFVQINRGEYTQFVPVRSVDGTWYAEDTAQPVTSEIGKDLVNENPAVSAEYGHLRA